MLFISNMQTHASTPLNMTVTLSNVEAWMM